MSARLEIPRTLTFSELQTPTAQGETDEILNNKSMVLVLYHISMTVPFAGDSPSQSNASPRKKPWELAVQSE